MRWFQSILVPAVILVLIASCTGSEPAHAQTASSSQVTLRVDGMTCASCNLTVKMALKRLDGVLDAEVTRKPVGRAVVTYEPGKATAEQMIEAVEKAGYKAYLETGSEN